MRERERDTLRHATSALYIVWRAIVRVADKSGDDGVIKIGHELGNVYRRMGEFVDPNDFHDYLDGDDKL